MQLVTQTVDDALLNDAHTLMLSPPQVENTTRSRNGNPLWSSEFEEEMFEDSRSIDTQPFPISDVPSDQLSSSTETTSLSGGDNSTPSSAVTTDNFQLEPESIDPRLFSIHNSRSTSLLVDRFLDKLPVNLRVSFIAIEEINIIFSDLYAPEGPSSPNLVSAINSTSQGRPLEGLLYAFNEFGLRPKLKGEKSSVLVFERATPLRYSLHVVGQPSPSAAVKDEQATLVPALNSPCRHVYIATDFSFDQYIINDVNSLATVMGKIIQSWRGLESNTGRVRPKPKTDEQLFEILQDDNDSLHPRFSEAEYAIENNCLLDACVSLLLPFGLRPHERDGQCVRFGHRAFDFEEWGIEIVRFDRFLSAEKKASLQEPFRSGVIVAGLSANTLEQREADLIRRIRRSACAAGCMVEFINGKFADKFGLVFSLHLEEDREDLVKRLLVHRDEKERQWKENITDKWMWGPHWLGKHPVSVKSDEEIQEIRKKMGKQAIGKPSPLSICMNASELV
jgi:hypothetical protein